MYMINYHDQNLYFYENEAQMDRGIPGKIREGRMIKFKIDKKEPLKNELKHFIECIREDKEPLVSGGDTNEQVTLGAI